jgi:hypothetical protein
VNIQGGRLAMETYLERARKVRENQCLHLGQTGSGTGGPTAQPMHQRFGPVCSGETDIPGHVREASSVPQALGPQHSRLASIKSGLMHDFKPAYVR